ncbi:MAG: hypothetical protein NBV67_07600 [Tagaea sp.]|nr:hypothetical protein [Tagaea sp.]
MADAQRIPSMMKRMTPRELTDLRPAAADSADDTQLPGHISGPNDALRHIIGAAELRRRYGPVAALAILEANEFRGNLYDKQTPADEAMDRHNNDLGMELGAGAQSYEEIVERAKALVAQGIAENGSGMFRTPIFLPPNLWRTADSAPDQSPIPDEFLERARNAPPRSIPDPAGDPYSGFGSRAPSGDHEWRRRGRLGLYARRRHARRDPFARAAGAQTAGARQPTEAEDQGSVMLRARA